MKEQQQAYTEGESEVFYQDVEQRIELYFGRTDAVVMDDIYEQGAYASNFGYRVSKERIYYLIDQDIPSIYDVDSLPTIYDKMKIEADELVEHMKKQPANHSFFLALYRLLHYYRMDLLLLGFSVLFFGSGFSTDYEYGFAWMMTLPRKCSANVLEKDLAAITMSLISLASFILVIFVAGLLTDGLGLENFPVLRYLKPVEDAYATGLFSGTFEFLAVGRILLETLGLLCAQILCLLSLSSAISTVKASPVALGLATLVLSALGYMASHVFYHPIWSMTPFAHLDSVAIVSGTRFIETGNSMFSVGSSIVVLILWKLIFLVITTLRTTPKRDYLS